MIHISDIQAGLKIIRNKFFGGKSELDGGAIFFSSLASSPLYIISDNMFLDCSANRGGGLAITNFLKNESIILQRNIFIQNKAEYEAGGIYLASLASIITETGSVYFGNTGIFSGAISLFFLSAIYSQ